MKYNFIFQDGRPLVVAGEKHPQEGGVLLDVPDAFDPHSAEDWLFQDGALVYTPLKTEEEKAAERAVWERAEQAEALDLALAATNGAVLEWFERLLTATSLAGMLAVLAEAKTDLHDVLETRKSLRAEIHKIKEA